ncbi:MAG: Fur family transcriptional regulator, partial [Christensenellales bacterium]
MATNYSSRRQAVLQVLQSTKSHPSAESIFVQCRLLIPNISLGTVYRNLALLEERGEIIKVANVAGVDRYDATVTPHVHRICPCCGRVEDVEVSDNLRDALYKEVDEKGYQSIQLTFYAKCKECEE